MLFLYIHGFNSSPLSYKARVTRQWLQQRHPDTRFLCPRLDNSPAAAIARLAAAIEKEGSEQQSRQVVLAGSSLGGYYATYLAEKYHLRALLINPGVQPHLHFRDALGATANCHTGERWTLEQRHMDQLAKLDVAQLQRPENFWTLLQTGDEVLDYRRAEAKYGAGRLTVEQGGDHSFQGYQRYLPAVYDFLLDARP